MASGDRTIWISNSGVDFGSGINWSNGVPANAGANDPNAYFGGPTGGSANCTASVDRSTDVFTLTVADDFAGDIGSRSAPLIWNASPAVHTIRGTGTMWLQPGGGGYFVVNSLNLDNAMTLLGSSSSVLVLSGGVTIDPTGEVFGLLGVFGFQADVVLALPDSTELPVNQLIVTAGTFTNHRDTNETDYWNISGGFVNATNTTWAVGHRVCIAGGTFEMNPTGASGGPAMSVINGTLDLSKSLFPITIKDLTVGVDATFHDVQLGATTDITVDLRKPYP